MCICVYCALACTCVYVCNKVYIHYFFFPLNCEIRNLEHLMISSSMFYANLSKWLSCDKLSQYSYPEVIAPRKIIEFRSKLVNSEVQ